MRAGGGVLERSSSWVTCTPRGSLLTASEPSGESGLEDRGQRHGGDVDAGCVLDCGGLLFIGFHSGIIQVGKQISALS